MGVSLPMSKMLPGLTPRVGNLLLVLENFNLIQFRENTVTEKFTYILK